MFSLISVSLMLLISGIINAEEIFQYNKKQLYCQSVKDCKADILIATLQHIASLGRMFGEQTKAHCAWIFFKKGIYEKNILSLTFITTLVITSISFGACTEGYVKYLWLFPIEGGKITFQLEKADNTGVVTINIGKANLPDADYFKQYQAMLQNALSNNIKIMPCYNENAGNEIVNIRMDKN